MSLKTITSRILLCANKKAILLNNNSHLNDCGRIRRIWGFLTPIFNKYDFDRVKEVGPDRACAEWLLRNGASVRYENGDEFLKDYNSLPPVNVKPCIVEVDATGSSISYQGGGFQYFDHTKKIRKIKLHKCDYVYDDALRHLAVLKKSLKDLQVSSCANITDVGILELANISSLEKLYIYDMISVKDKEKCTQVLKEALPNCNVNFPWAHEREIPKKSKDDDKNDK